MGRQSHYYYCKVCGHEVVPTFRGGVFHHWDRREDGGCRHMCEMDMMIDVSSMSPVEWKRGKLFQEFGR